MLETLAIVGSLVALPAMFAVARWLERRLPPPPDFFEPITVRAFEPCWTEEIASDDRFHYGRAQCVNDALIDLDARARRGDDPFGPIC